MSASAAAIRSGVERGEPSAYLRVADRLVALMRADEDSDWAERLQAAIDVADDRPLSPREVEVLSCASYGLTAEMTAEVLGIEAHTARNHRAAAILRMRAKNVTHAVALAIRSGVIA